MVRTISTYLALTYLLSGVALFLIGLPKLRGAAGRPAGALVMFPVMVLGIGVLGLTLTAITAGKAGLGDLRSQFRWPARRRWLLVLLIPPIVIITVLSVPGI